MDYSFKEPLRVGTMFCFCFVFLLGPHMQHMELPRLGVELELQLPAYTTATATRDRSCVCELHHSSQQQRRILNPPSEARDRTHNLTVPSQISFCCATTGTPSSPFYNQYLKVVTTRRFEIL